jgi:hypothetical protein
MTTARPARRPAGRRNGGARAALLLALLAGLWLAAPGPEQAPARAAPDPPPLLAHYYIWYDQGSWNRAKTDLPALGPYTSGDTAVMRQQIAWAQQAGIRGFIVSWKGTRALNSRLKQLISVADAADFKLAIVYQGLDFDQHPLPVDQVAADLDTFLAQFAADRAFTLFDKPLIAWSGSWEYSAEDVARVTGPRRDRLRILATEKSVEGYARLAPLVDGNLYYWSSVNPQTNSGFAAKLLAMGQAVHHDGGLWIAPAAPGFDARLVGGAQVVERRDGATLREELAAARASQPDAIGLISWNEFSENTHIEPSRNYGRQYLDLLAQIWPARPQATAVPVPLRAAATPPLRLDSVLALGLAAALVAASLLVIVRRNRRRPPPAPWRDGA